MYKVELRGDRTNKWTPNMSALKSALEMAQFDVIASAIYGERGLVGAKAILDDELERYRRLDYGTGVQW